MTKEEMIANLENLKYNFANYESIECTQSDVMTIDAILNFIKYGLKVFSTNELVDEVMRREGIQVVKKVNLDDGAVG